MVETPKVDSPAFLRHEYRTPVNHIVGYTELLIDEAPERNLERFIPAFEAIQHGGHKLLESIQNAFSEHSQPGEDWEGAAFRGSLQGTLLDISRTLSLLDEDLDRGHRETLADLAAISGGIRRLCDLLGVGEREIPGPGDSLREPHIEDLPLDLVPVPVNRGGGKLLIADDDDAGRALLRRRLECEGHEVTEVKNGLEVLDALKDARYDLVLLDILMPAMDGFQVLARMKRDAALRDLPVIMISALEELQSVVRCIEMGAEDYLSKPFNRVLLRARIGASLEKKWLRDREHLKTQELERTLSLLEKAQEELAIHASQDALTALANRRSVEAQLDSRANRNAPLTAIYIDLNGFKRINDTYGHEAGDDLLRQVGGRLRSAFRATDTIGRWGGDEFIALVDETGPSLQISLSRVRESFAGEFVIHSGEAEHRVQIGASVGVATWKPHDTISELLHRADFAMYEEKLSNAG